MGAAGGRAAGRGAWRTERAQKGCAGVSGSGGLGAGSVGTLDAAAGAGVGVEVGIRVGPGSGPRRAAAASRAGTIRGGGAAGRGSTVAAGAGTAGTRIGGVAGGCGPAAAGRAAAAIPPGAAPAGNSAFAIRRTSSNGSSGWLSRLIAATVRRIECVVRSIASGSERLSPRISRWSRSFACAVNPGR